VEKTIGLREALKALAQARGDEQLVICQARQRLNAVEQLPAWRCYTEARVKVAAAKDATKAARAVVGDATLAAFKATGDKKPMAGASIRMFKRLIYRTEEVWNWLAVNAPTYLVVDKKRFEKAVPTLQGVPATIEYEPRVAVSGDLSAYLREPDPDPTSTVLVKIGAMDGVDELVF